MCLTPIKFYSTAKILRKNGQPYLLTVPCGHCAQCLKQKRNEYLLRCYFEALSTYQQKGFIYFDTLTYADNTLPHISNFVPLTDSQSNYICFSRQDTRLFFSRLRSKLTRLGFHVSGNLKYFLTSEYGTSDNGTHRSHYHVLFFCTIPGLSAYKFSKLVSECWSNGRTDGFPYKRYSYVRDHCFGYDYSPNLVHCLSVCKYVSKYIVTDSDFQSVVNSRISSLMESKYGLYWHDDYDAHLDFLSYKRLMCQFHLQSNGFGEDALKYNNNYDHVLKDGWMLMPSSDTVVQRINLPMYYKRKLFYTLEKDYRGLRQWRINPLGVQWLTSRLHDNIDEWRLKFESWYVNLPKLVPVDYATSIQVDVLKLMGSRSFADFATYIYCYKGRIKSSDMLASEKLGVFECEDLDSWIPKITNPDYEGSESFFVSYGTALDKNLYGSKFVSELCNSDPIKHNDKVESLRLFWKDRTGQALVDSRFAMKPSDFHRTYCITDLSDSRFRYFDKIYELFLSTLVLSNEQKQKAFITKERLKAKFKPLLSSISPFKI